MLRLPLSVETRPPSNVTVDAEVVVAEPVALEPWMSRLPLLVAISALIVTLLTAPKTKVRAPDDELILWLMLIEPAAIIVSVAAPPEFFVISADMVMLPDWPPVVENVKIVTLVPASSDFSIVVLFTVADPVLSGVKTFGEAELKDPCRSAMQYRHLQDPITRDRPLR